MHIAIIIEKMNPARGGREKSTASIASKLASLGHRVTILCQESDWSFEGVEVCQLGLKGLSRDARLNHFVCQAGTEIKSRDFDISHSMLAVPGVDLYQVRGGTVPAQINASQNRKGGVAGSLSCLSWKIDATRRLLARYEKQVVQDHDVMLLTVSEMVCQEFKHYYGRTHNVRVLFNGVDAPDSNISLRNQWRSEIRKELDFQDGLIFLTVAANPDLKGVPEAIEAFARWQQTSDTPGRYIIIGCEPSKKCLKAASRNKLDNSVSFRSYTDNVFKWYAAADCCVLLSWYDACSRVVLEAFRYGLPSITTVYNGAAEALASGGGIVVSSPGDIPAVASAMTELADPESRAGRSSICLADADKYSMDNHVNQLVEIYEERCDY